MADQVGKNATMKGTNQFKRRGQTAGPYGNDPGVQPKGKAAAPARDLKP